MQSHCIIFKGQCWCHNKDKFFIFQSGVVCKVIASHSKDNVGVRARTIHTNKERLVGIQAVILVYTTPSSPQVLQKILLLQWDLKHIVALVKIMENVTVIVRQTSAKVMVVMEHH